MPAIATRALPALLVLAGLALAGCQGTGGMGDWFSSSPPPPPAPPVRPSIAPSDIIGRWGIASYHREQDRARWRREKAAEDEARRNRPRGGRVPE